MKKLIILSAIAISSLIYSSANAQERTQNDNRFRHERYDDQHFENRGHQNYVQPRFQNDHHENWNRGDEHFSRDHNYDRK
jgi:Ni/Co efflux regulator RcnB